MFGPSDCRFGVVAHECLSESQEHDSISRHEQSEPLTLEWTVYRWYLRSFTHLSNVMCSNRVGSPSSESRLVFHYLIFLKHLIAGRNKSEPLNSISSRSPEK